MPRYDRFERMRADIPMSIVGGAVDATWATDSKSFTFLRNGDLVRYDVAARKVVGNVTGEEAEPPPTGFSRAIPARGRQFDVAYSPSGKLKAYFKDRNLRIGNIDGSSDYAVTTARSSASRTKFGQASWVYGEELGVREAMWWSPDGKKLAYYGFDESRVPDYYIAMDQTEIQDKLDVEAYPKAGVDNPIVTLYLYDLASKSSTAVDTRFGDPALGEYVYDVRWSPNGQELLFNRTDRHQRHWQLVAADPDSGKCRVVVEEDWSKTWTENHPPVIWYSHDQPQRFLFLSERNGFQNIYRGDLGGSPLVPVTGYNSFEVQSVLRIDEKNGQIYFLARDGENPYKLQLHRINIDGSHDQRLTDPAFNHLVSIAPNGAAFVDVEQDLDTPAFTTLRDSSGRLLDTVAKPDASQFEKLGLKKVKRIVFKAADGVTDLYGYVEYPSDFDPKKKYPLLVSVYGGPESGASSERFLFPNALTELGFLVADFDGRGTVGRGKAFKDAVYKHLGIVEIDDQAAGVKYLDQLPYVDKDHVGIFGTSYGGYASAMCLLRHPECFQAAASSSPVTDWLNYDSIYTERYMSLPKAGDNEVGYEAAAAKTYAQNLKGELMLYYGTADNNVHDANSLQLIQALQNAGKSFEVQVGPDQGHSQMISDRMWEFFIQHLILLR